ncbi:iron uptake system protein EfeO [Mycobacteroides immunogenum]|uniref:Peptidase M75 n=1 Tax=Mycobacteroides immunogenum TaxID=83262 RepID=A0A7V8LLP0_9MYCO|nr:iron uptake system protein EfeO [Mycobacteroides immunogenum]AMT69976.1 peptidase M75 [Mycobacteroides immunogenum]ANO03035.1 peptidase M75 [Mycobacteroides immunogenum]KIU38397.1 peptidase M75 [Mycobacteroides immunogenum]KPG05503.1 peptidase M75 [Mycobacteroides immunogenum]KPG06374.1 peptidase M75 [Mycobacteroides immunogenum]
MRSPLAYVSAALAVATGAALAGCTPKEPVQSGAAGGQEISVTATDSSCQVSKTEGTTGPVTFNVTNNGSKVTEFYVYDKGDRALGEVENIGSGISRKLIVQFTEPGTYQTACKPGMIGDGIRGDFTITGAAVKLDAEGKFKDATDRYRGYVISQVDALSESAAKFVEAVKAKDIASAKAQYPTSRVYYERIEPVAEAFPNDLDPRIDLREADLQPGEKWTGYHRLEKDLWVTGLQPDTDAIADQLLKDIKELSDGVRAKDFDINTTKIAGGAQTLLDEVARTKISGEEETFSHTDLWDFQANLDGSQNAIATVRPILDERKPELGQAIDKRFKEVDALLGKYRKGDGFVLYDTVTQDQRIELAHAIDALSKEVSEVQGVVAGR